MEEKNTPEQGALPVTPPVPAPEPEASEVPITEALPGSTVPSPELPEETRELPNEEPPELPDTPAEGSPAAEASAEAEEGKEADSGIDLSILDDPELEEVLFAEEPETPAPDQDFQ